MADDTNNNFVVTGATMNASIATDYSVSESSHFQVVKVAFGDSASGGTRVEDGVGLPVDIIQSIPLNITSISNPVSLAGSIAVYGIAGATAVGVTASNLDIRGITHTRDSIKVLGGVTVTNGEGDPYATGISPFVGFQTRLLRATKGATAMSSGSNLQTNLLSDPSAEDTVRVVGLSGAYPVGVTAVDLDIRSLTFSSDSVSVFNTVKVENGTNSSATPFSTTITDGFQTRVLRATTGADAATSAAALTATTVEDTVRVVGLSGAYPVDVVNIGLTAIANRTTRVPFRVNDTGALYVNLESGSISATATISGSQFVLSGVSLAPATGATMTVQINGYTGPGAIAVGVTATDLDIRNLTVATDAVYAQTRLLGGACGDEVGITGAAWTIIQKFDTAITSPSGGNRIRTDDANGTDIKNGINALDVTLTSVNGKITQNAALGNGIAVSVVGVAQPTGITSGRVTVTTSATALGSFALTSGIHLKTDLGNSNTNPIFVGAGSAVSTTNGYPLYNGDQIFIETDNANKISFACATAGLTLYYVGT